MAQRLVTQGGFVPGYTPGSFCIWRSYGWNTAGGTWTPTNIRADAGWVDTCPQLNTVQRTQAQARAVIRRINFRLIDGGALLIAQEAVPGPRYVTCRAGLYPETTVDYDPAWGAFKFYLNWDTNLTELEVQLWFDIPKS